MRVEKVNHVSNTNFHENYYCIDKGKKSCSVLHSWMIDAIHSRCVPCALRGLLRYFQENPSWEPRYRWKHTFAFMSSGPDYYCNASRGNSSTQLCLTCKDTVDCETKPSAFRSSQSRQLPPDRFWKNLDSRDLTNYYIIQPT